EVERPRRAHVVGNLVGGEIRETGVQLSQRGPELGGDAFALQPAGALACQIAAGEDARHRLVVERRPLQRAQERRGALRCTWIERREYREGDALRSHFRIARAL